MFPCLKPFAAVLAFASAQAVLPELAAAQDVTRFHHKQWQAECGPDYCTLMPRAEPHFALMRGHRGGPWVLSFETDADAAGRFSIDGKGVDWAVGQKMPFPEALLDGNIFEIAYFEAGEEAGFGTGSSLAGIKAALIWAEAQQPATKMARMLELRQPDWAALEAQAVEMTRQSCDIPMEHVSNGRGAQMIPDHPELRVLEHPCWMAAYNTGSTVYLLGPMIDGVAPVRAAARAEGEDVPEVGLYALSGDIMTSGSKGRGVGDCFTRETWRFDGFVYQLERRIVDDDCDGKLIPRLVWPN
ncbi:DUF1176 domain-containing protein [Celeribacter neptunius]|uniref:DUF1176 domain-containing protein n=1 Tax=Celeribacter neptunius TaxID=588602 RepID=A0A1I3K6V8_9RHOB|nr:DUF1176 domain-containing protein [Celeribacter neptunius]SFI68030.1 Protein of unknown function [Celeribacter neptunius]